MYYIRISGLFLCFCAAGGFAQTVQSIHGEIATQLGESAEGYMIVLNDPVSHMNVERTIANSNSFEFHNVTPGRYEVQLTNDNGDVLSSAQVDMSRQFGPVQLRLPSLVKARPGSGTVSMASLRNPAPRKAVQEMKEAQKFSQAGDAPHAIEHLQKAIAIHANYVEAHNNLAVQYLRLHQWADARQELETALRIGPPGPEMYSNLSALFMAERQFPEAESAAREALRLDSRNARAHYLLGRTLLLKPDSQAEAFRHIQFAAADLPAARNFLEKMNAPAQ